MGTQCPVHLTKPLWNRSRVGAPDNFARRKDGPASKYAGRVHIHDFCPREGQHVPIKESDIPAAIMAAGELAGEGFGLARVRRLEWRESLLARHSVIEKKSRPARLFDL